MEFPCLLPVYDVVTKRVENQVAGEGFTEGAKITSSVVIYGEREPDSGCHPQSALDVARQL